MFAVSDKSSTFVMSHYIYFRKKKHINTLFIRIERKPCIFAKVDETQTTSQQGFLIYVGF